MRAISCVLGMVVLLAGCSAVGGPRTAEETNLADLPDRYFDAINDCSLKYPDQEQSFDPTTGYFYWEGQDAEKLRQCLVTNHGWTEFGPPAWKPGTMAPPR